ISLSVIFIIIIIFSIYSYTKLAESRKNQLKQLEIKNNLYIDLMTVSLKEFIWNYDHINIKEIFSSVSQDKDIYSIILYNENYTEIISEVNAGEFRNLSYVEMKNTIVKQNNLVFSEAKIEYQKYGKDPEVIAYLVIITRLDIIQNLIRKNTQSFIITIIIFAVTLIICISYMVYRLINEPIQYLIHATQTIVNNRDMQIQINSTDELSTLASSFQSMINELNLKEKELLNQEQLKKELEIARKIQTSLLPSIPVHQELEITAMMHPATDVGGDYYDIVNDGENNLWFAIGDVSGHGVTPGLVMMMAETAFHTTLLSSSQNNLILPSEAIKKVNLTLFENIRKRLKESHFMTMTLLKYIGDGKFLFSGKHIDLLIYRYKSKKCEMIKTRGVYLGIIPDIQKSLKDEKFQLESNDLLILYTDGIIEAKNPEKELFSPERLQKIILDNYDKPINKIKHLILSESLKWCSYQQVDDITMVIIKKK
ncbi:MAG: SpoIIE family protein phosphatase, partial [Spirochaetes bacterium]|nr:SpoIIE family protein phosphatase [Spirochaetota bacterium]